MTRRTCTGWNAVEDGEAPFFLSREEYAVSGFPLRSRNGVTGVGEETWGRTVAARVMRRSRPLPTKAIDEVRRCRVCTPCSRRFGEYRFLIKPVGMLSGDDPHVPDTDRASPSEKGRCKRHGSIVRGRVQE